MFDREGDAWRIEDLPHDVALADDVRVRELFGEIGTKAFVLGGEPPLFECLVDGMDDFLVLERLGDVVKRTVLHRLDRAVDRGESGDDDDWKIGVGDAD